MNRRPKFLRCLVGPAVLLLAGIGQLRAAVPIPPGMAQIPEGVYRPLFRAETDAKEVRVKSFCLDIFPVTNEEFLEFVRANPRWQRSRVRRILADESYLKDWADDLELGTNAPAKAPVAFVSWFAARAFARSNGKRLPTIAEWEYAASASPTRADGENDLEFKKQVREWYASPAGAGPAAVGQRQPNFFGVQDLHGLVWEWVADFYKAMVAGDARGNTGLDREPFCAAGSQGATDLANYPAFMRYAFRSSLKTDYCIHNLGFRCAKDL